MSHRWCGVAVCVLALLVSAVAPAAAQVQTGSVYVRVVDDQGAVVPGVTITISSPVLPRDHVGVTDASGVFQVPGLSVGIYSVRSALQGFQTVNRADIVVRQGQTANVEIAMKVSGLSEEVTVRGESPVVDTKTVGAQVNIDTNLLEKAPGGRDIWNVIEYKAPGVVVESPDVGGNQGGLQRSLSARGTPNAQNTQVLNGVNVNDPAAQGFAMYYYVPTTLENIQVSTGGQDIAVGTGGVFINMVTKSGTNRFSGMALQTYQGAPTQSSNIDEPLLQAGLRPDANSTELLTNTNVQAGGPLLRNRVFYFGTFNYQATHVNVPNFPAVIPSYIPSPLADTSDQDTTDIIAGEGKISYQPDGRNRFEGFIAKQRYDKPNRGAGGTVTVLNANVLAGTQDSDSKELDTFFIAQLAYNRVMSDRMFIDSKISYNNTHFPLSQKTDLQPLSDTSTAVLFRNRQSSQIMFRRRIQFVANWQYFLPELLGGRHEFKAGIDNGHTPEDVDTLRIGEVNLSHASLPTPRAGQVQIFNTPLHQERAVTSTALYAQDAYSIGRLTLTGGIRWERVEGYLPAQQAPPSEYFPEGLVFEDVSINGVVQDFTVRKSFDAVKENPLWYNWGPRVSATYDIRGNGKTVARVLVRKIPGSNQYRHAAKPERQHQPDLCLERSERRSDLPEGQRDLERHAVRRRRVRSARQHGQSGRGNVRQERPPAVPQRTDRRRRSRAVAGRPLQRRLPAHAGTRRHGHGRSEHGSLGPALHADHVDRPGPRRSAGNSRRCTVDGVQPEHGRCGDLARHDQRRSVGDAVRRC